MTSDAARWLLLGSLGLGGLAGCTPPAPALAPVTLPTPRLTLALVVDQLALWHAVERFPTLPASGGFARLLREADAAVELRYGYVQTSTAMGHSALFSGLTPHESGITANEVLDAEGRRSAIVLDRQTRLVGAEGPIDRPGASLAAFAPARETFADALRRQRPDVSIACFSMKDRGAVFACGRSPDAVLWFDWKADAFVTSTAYASGFPARLARFGTSGAGAAARTAPWTPLDPTWLTTHAGTGDVGQGDFEGLGAAFPHSFDGLDRPARALLATPFADTLLVDLTLAWIDGLPRERDAYVAVSFSAYDYVHHMFGPGAPESWDALLRLDRELARLFTALDQRVGATGFAVVLSADHGGPPAPEGPESLRCPATQPDRFERPCTPAIRLDETALARVAEEAAAEVVGPGRWIVGASEPFLVLSPQARALPTADLDRLVRAEVAALERVDGVARVIDARGTEGGTCPPPPDDSLDALICRSLAGPERGDLLVIPRPGAFFETGYVEGDGCNHGTPYLFDRSVPLIVRSGRRADQRAPSRAPFAAGEHVDPAAYTAALARLLRVTPPQGVAGKDLTRSAR